MLQLQVQRSCCRTLFLTDSPQIEGGRRKGQLAEMEATMGSYEVVSGLNTQHRDYRFATFVTCVGSDQGTGFV